MKIASPRYSPANFNPNRIKRFQSWVNTTYKLVPRIKVSGIWDATTELMYGKYGSIFESATKGRQVAPKPAIVGQGLEYPTKEKSGSPVSQPTGVVTTTTDDKGMSNTFTYIIIGLAIGVGYVLITKKK
jgi:hypothetical protein